MNPTSKDIDVAMKELSEALHESFEANKAEEDIKLKKIKAHCRLRLVRDTVRNLTFNN